LSLRKINEATIAGQEATSCRVVAADVAVARTGSDEVETGARLLVVLRGQDGGNVVYQMEGIEAVAFAAAAAAAASVVIQAEAGLEPQGTPGAFKDGKASGVPN
jgi:hypothetical protein